MNVLNAGRAFARMARLGSLGAAIRFTVARLIGRETVRINMKGNSLLLRVASTDAKVAMGSLDGEFDVLKSTLDADFAGLVVDGGAYIGTASLALADLFPNATIVAVEASAENFDILVKNVASKPNIKPVNAALFHEAGLTLDLTDREKGAWGYSVIKRSRDNLDARKIQTIKTTTIDEIRKAYPELTLGVIKLDIEGAEKELLEKAGVQLDEAHVVLVELHDRIVDGCRTAFQEFSRNRKTLKCGHEKHLSIAT